MNDLSSETAETGPRLMEQLMLLIGALANKEVTGAGAIPWACPVLSFGDFYRSEVATVGLNPSNREFQDQFGNELNGGERRFHTLTSLGLQDWSDVQGPLLLQMVGSYRGYFSGNPYTRWFGPLDEAIAGSGASFFSDSNPACHIDLVPYATAEKWGDLSLKNREVLTTWAADSIAILLRESAVQLLVLNGRSVVTGFERLAELSLSAGANSGWDLRRAGGSLARGMAYKGKVSEIRGIALGREILVLGYNINLQSSFGVTSRVRCEIRKWIGREWARRRNEQR
jgi:hypothetical protein